MFDGGTTDDTVLAGLAGNQPPSVISSTGNQMLLVFNSHSYTKHSAGSRIHARIHYGNVTTVTTPYPTGTTTGTSGTTSGYTSGTSSGGSTTGGSSTPNLGEQGYCSTQNPCDINEGHCTADDQCMGDMMCGSDNCLPVLGFANGTNCCYGLCHMVDMKNGFLTSPNYPDFYLNNLDCSDQISVEEGKLITIEFESFNVSSRIYFPDLKIKFKIINHGFRWKLTMTSSISVMATVLHHSL